MDYEEKIRRIQKAAAVFQALMDLPEDTRYNTRTWKALIPTPDGSGILAATFEIRYNSGDNRPKYMLAVFPQYGDEVQQVFEVSQSSITATQAATFFRLDLVPDDQQPEWKLEAQTMFKLPKDFAVIRQMPNDRRFAQ